MDISCCVKFRKIKSMSALNGAYIHNETIEGRSQAPNVNQDRTFYSLLDNKLPYTEKWYERVADSEVKTKWKIKPRKDAVYAVESVCSLSHGAEQVVDINEWTRQTKEWALKTFGKENVIGFSVHLDESSPHIHIMTIPIDEEGHLNNKRFLGGPGKLQWLQTDYAKQLDSLGIKRGIINSKAKAESLKQFYTVLNKTLKETLPIKESSETEEEYYTKINTIYSDAKLQTLKLQKDLSHEIRERVAFEQQNHHGITFQNRIKQLYKENADEVFKVLDNLSDDEFQKLLAEQLRLFRKKKTEMLEKNTGENSNNIQER